VKPDVRKALMRLQRPMGNQVNCRQQIDVQKADTGLSVVMLAQPWANANGGDIEEQDFLA
jgi:hypothetical protein